MIFDTLQYVDVLGVTQEVALSLVNVAGVPANNRVKFTPRSHAAGEFEITWAQPPETPIAIPFKSRCIVWAGRESSSGAKNSFTKGTMIFQGRRWDNAASASAAHVSTSITLMDAWKDLEKVTYAIPWNYISGGTLAAPTYSTYPFQDIVLFQAAPGTTYNPPAVSGTITTWQQIQDIINYAANYAGGSDAVQIQLAGAGVLTGSTWSAGSGAEFTPSYCNWYPVRSAKCSEVLTICLRPHPGVFTEMDYSTTPPTLHFRNRANLQAITLPYKSTDAAGVVHLATDIQALDELVPDAVRLWYKINGTFNGQTVVSFNSDCYPSSASSLLTLDFAVDITGASTAQTIYDFVSTPFDPTSKALWRKKVNSLKQLSEGGQIPNDGSTGALALLDTTINGGSGHADGLQVVDESGNPIDTSVYQYYTDATVYNWMTVSGVPVVVAKANVVGMFSYNKNTGGALNLTPKIGRHSHSMRLKLTNAPSGRYWMKQTLNTGEAIPANLAQRIYNELADLQWKLRHEIIQVAADAASLPTFIKPGKHKINLSGGAAAWTTMNAVPENVSIELFRTSEGKLVAHHVINCGPVNHLEPGYLVQLTNLFCNRNRSGIDAYQRLSGGMSSTQVDLSSEATRENSVPANADFTQQIVYAPDTLDATRSLAITHDATNGVLTVAQLKSSDGSNYTTGLIAPEYNGAGAPTASTLATNAYYRLYSKYWDTSGKQWYVCTTAGDKTSSVWTVVSGGGGISFYAITTLSGGDYFVAVPITITFPSGVLTLAFGTAVNVAKYNRQRPSVGSELIDGLTITYSAYVSDNTRTASDGTNTEYQVCFPRYTTMTTLGFSSYISSPPTGATALTFLNSQCVVKCCSLATGVKDGSGNPIVIEELPQRVWARRFVQ